MPLLPHTFPVLPHSWTSAGWWVLLSICQKVHSWGIHHDDDGDDGYGSSNTFRWYDFAPCWSTKEAATSTTLYHQGFRWSVKTTQHDRDLFQSWKYEWIVFLVFGRRKFESTLAWIWTCNPGLAKTRGQNEIDWEFFRCWWNVWKAVMTLSKPTSISIRCQPTPTDSKKTRSNNHNQPTLATSHSLAKDKDVQAISFACQQESCSQHTTAALLLCYQQQRIIIIFSAFHHTSRLYQGDEEARSQESLHCSRFQDQEHPGESSHVRTDGTEHCER